MKLPSRLKSACFYKILYVEVIPTKQLTAPKFLALPKPVNVLEGQQAILSARVTGNPGMFRFSYLS